MKNAMIIIAEPRFVIEEINTAPESDMHTDEPRKTAMRFLARAGGGDWGTGLEYAVLTRRAWSH